MLLIENMRRRPNNRNNPANPPSLPPPNLPHPLPLLPQPHPPPRNQQQSYHQPQQQTHFQNQQQPPHQQTHQPTHHLSPQKSQQQTSHSQNRQQPHHLSPQHVQQHTPHPQTRQQSNHISPQHIQQKPPHTHNQQQPHQLSPQHIPQPPSHSQNRQQPLPLSPQRTQQQQPSHSQNRQQPHHLSPQHIQQQSSHSQNRPQSQHLSPQHIQKSQNLPPHSTNMQSLQLSPQRTQHQNRPPSLHTSPQKIQQHPTHQNPQQTQQSHLQAPPQRPPVMANLNFQQAPRSLASGGVGSRGLVGGVSGHVTPTFGGALSPGRGSTAMPGGAPPAMASRSTLFGQRAFADRRVPMPTTLAQPNSNSMSSMGNLTRFNAGNNYHSVFGEGGDTSTPPLLDLSEFPSLTARGAGDQAPAAAPPPPGSKPYVGMVKQPTSEQSEFTMSSEDFPALPGTSSTGGAPAAPAQPGPPAPALTNPEYTNHNADKPRKGIQTSPDGKVTNIPETMIPNQFGIVGLLTFIRAAESDPSLVSLALGQDLTALGLNLNSPDNLYLTFAGPWADTPCRPQDMDYHVPPEYLINGSIREKLAPLRLNRYKEDLLFYLFYCFVGDVLQIAAAAELYNREWRYHMEEKVWISQAPGMPMVEKTSTYERGTYYFFDAHNWRKVAKEFHLDYSKLEGRPQLPSHVVT